jgi:hypothetical protein
LNDGGSASRKVAHHHNQVLDLLRVAQDQLKGRGGTSGDADDVDLADLDRSSSAASASAWAAGVALGGMLEPR